MGGAAADRKRDGWATVHDLAIAREERHREIAKHALSFYVGATQPEPLPAAAPLGIVPTEAWPEFDDAVTHPGHGLQPRTVVSIFKQAEIGALWQQADLFADIRESDGHLQALIHSRRDSVAGCDWVIQPGAPDEASQKAAELLRAIMPNALEVGAFLEHHLMAPYYGYSASAIVWNYRAGTIGPSFINAPHRRFHLASGGRLEYIRARGFESKPLAAGQWVVSCMSHENLARAGLLRCATWFAMFKRMSIRDWVIFAERFGVPLPIGTYAKNSTEDARKVLEQALVELGDAGRLVIEEGTKVAFAEVSQRAGDPKAVHPAIISLCEAQMSKLINGATQNVEQGAAGSYAQARVHESRSFKSERADAKRVGDVFEAHVGAPFVLFNGFPEGTAPPRLHVQISRDYDPQTRIDVASKLCNELGAEVDGAPLFDELGFRRPVRAEDTLRGTKNAGKEEAPAGGPPA